MSEPADAHFDTGLRPEDLDPERPRLFESPWGTLALYTVEREVLAAQAFCPHLQGPLFQGTLSGATITCPWHQWRYDLRTGRRLDAARPPFGHDARPIRVFAVERTASGTLLVRPRGPSSHAT
ncbi:MAG TPA: Rieske 2Fe-2S domain-containing protein [Planctomycetota bacterium]|nr:Rieske 2Fe-2S domain-containing protein [Planctomycetota bacterium]